MLFDISAGSSKIFDSGELAVSQAAFDVTPIGAGYDLLQIIILGRSDRAGSNFDLVSVQFNGDTGANYDYAWSQDGGGLSGGAVANPDLAITAGATAPAGNAGALWAFIPNYDRTTFNKEIRASASDARGAGIVSSSYGHVTWKSTAAITRIKLFPHNGNWIAGSRCMIYGIK